MPNNFSALCNEDGTAVVLTITQSDGTVASMPVPANEAGYVSLGILAGAVDCARKSGKRIKLAKKIDPAKLEHKYLKNVHEVAVSDASDDSDVVVLIFATGATEFGIGIPRECLSDLGRSLTALSASGTAH